MLIQPRPTMEEVGGNSYTIVPSPGHSDWFSQNTLQDGDVRNVIPTARCSHNITDILRIRQRNVDTNQFVRTQNSTFTVDAGEERRRRSEINEHKQIYVAFLLCDRVHQTTDRPKRAPFQKERVG